MADPWRKGFLGGISECLWVHFQQVVAFLQLIFSRNQLRTTASTGFYCFFGSGVCEDHKESMGTTVPMSKSMELLGFGLPAHAQTSRTHAPSKSCKHGPEPEEMYYNCATYYISDDLTASSCRQPCINNPDRASLSSFETWCSNSFRFPTEYELRVPGDVCPVRSGTVHRQPTQDLLQ